MFGLSRKSGPAGIHINVRPELVEGHHFDLCHFNELNEEKFPVAVGISNRPFWGVQGRIMSKIAVLMPVTN